MLYCAGASLEGSSLARRSGDDGTERPWQICSCCERLLTLWFYHLGLLLGLLSGGIPGCLLYL